MNPDILMATEMENGKSKIALLYEEQTFKLNGLAFAVQNQLGRFSREKQYSNFYETLLVEAKIPYQRELVIGDSGNILDFFVYNCTPLEIKAKPYITKEDYYQLQRYLKALNAELGIIYNFRDRYLKPKRILRETRKDPQLSADPDSVRISGSET